MSSLLGLSNVGIATLLVPSPTHTVDGGRNRTSGLNNFHGHALRATDSQCLAGAVEYPRGMPKSIMVETSGASTFGSILATAGPPGMAPGSLPFQAGVIKSSWIRRSSWRGQ